MLQVVKPMEFRSFLYLAVVGCVTVLGRGGVPEPYHETSLCLLCGPGFCNKIEIAADPYIIGKL